MSRQHIDVKNGIWLLEKTMVIDSPWLHNRWLHGLSNDQGMTNFADGHWKHEDEMLTRGAELLIWPKSRSCYKHTVCGHLSGPGNTTSWAALQESKSSWVTGNQAMPTRNWKNAQWQSDQGTYGPYTCQD